MLKDVGETDWHQTSTIQWWGLLGRFLPFPHFPNFATSPKYMLFIEYHNHIWQVSPQLSCGDIYQIWMWFKEYNRYWFEIENFAYGEIDEWSYSAPHFETQRKPWEVHFWGLRYMILVICKTFYIAQIYLCCFGMFCCCYTYHFANPHADLFSVFCLGYIADTSYVFVCPAPYRIKHKKAGPADTFLAIYMCSTLYMASLYMQLCNSTCEWHTLYGTSHVLLVLRNRINAVVDFTATCHAAYKRIKVCYISQYG